MSIVRNDLTHRLCEVWMGIWVPLHCLWALAALWMRVRDLQELGMLIGMTFRGLHSAFSNSPWCLCTGTRLSYLLQRVGGGSHPWFLLGGPAMAQQPGLLAPGCSRGQPWIARRGCGLLKPNQAAWLDNKCSLKFPPLTSRVTPGADIYY